VPASAQAATGDFAAFPICTEPADQLKPQVEGELVVWQDQRAGNNDVYGRYLSGNEFPICTHAGGQDFPAVYGNVTADGRRNRRVEAPVDSVGATGERARLYEGGICI